jgi:hypothetical protein
MRAIRIKRRAAVATLGLLAVVAGGSALPAIAPAADSTLAPTLGATYHPVIDPANFVANINNPYLPFKRGTSLKYRGLAEDGKTPQLDVEKVTRRTKQILGVNTTVVVDKVTSRGKPVEKTLDWYAQDKQGNVWYLGEDARDFKHGHYVHGVDSWEAGVDGAQPGIIMEANPRPGDTYRQEFYPGHALDQARVIGVRKARVKVPFGSFRKTLVVDETSPLEPGVVARKWHVRGIGVVKERVIKGNQELLELFSAKR